MPEIDSNPEPCEEKEAHEVCLLITKIDVLLLLECLSTCNRLKRITAWMNCFIQNCRAYSTNNTPWTDPLTTSELATTGEHWIITVQSSMFPDEVASLQKGSTLSCNSKILPLHPFLDQNSILHVFGR